MQCCRSVAEFQAGSAAVLHVRAKVLYVGKGEQSVPSEACRASLGDQCMQTGRWVPTPSMFSKCFEFHGQKLWQCTNARS